MSALRAKDSIAEATSVADPLKPESIHREKIETMPPETKSMAYPTLLLLALI